MVSESEVVTSETEIRKAIGTPPNTVYLKKINLLEEHSKRYLEMSHLMAISVQNIPTRIHLIATQQSKLVIVDDTKFTLKVRNIGESATPIQDEPCGLYVLVAGFEESLRINGKVCITSRGDGISVIEIKIDEHYFHCAKSIKRSHFWTSIDYTSSMDNPLGEVEFSDSNVKDFIQKSPFLLLATQNKKGEADLSPRGDPGGFLRVLDGHKVLIPERPGNKIADSLRNIIINSSMAIILFIPGTKLSLILTGDGKLTNSQTALKAFEIRNKIPKMGIELTVKKTYFGVNPALADKNLWDKADFGDRSVFPSLGMIVSEQLQSAGKMPGSGSVIGRVLGKLVGAVSQLAIKQDYKKNLY